jgi:putative ABC transport system permease protein
MSLLASLRTALRALTRNKLRSLLAMLGIVIAVGAVVATVAIGQGAQVRVAEQMASLGSNLIMVLPGSVMTRGAASGSGATQTLTREDAAAIERELGRSVAAVAPISRTSGQIINGDANWFTQVLGTSAGYLAVRGWPLAQGEPFGRAEENIAAKVCLLGHTVKDKLFGEGPAVGQQIRVNRLPCKVIGVLATKGQSSFGQDQDDVVILPWSTVAHRLQGSQSDAVGQLVVSARAPELIGAAQAEIAALLRQRHHIAEAAGDDFQLRNLAELQESALQQSRTLSLLLGSVALISLLVGAIGIANVMLVSVTERTREIGIRLAVGARGRDVLFQFLVEAVLLAVLGGLIGIALGSAAARVMAARGSWPTVLSVPVMGLTVLLAGVAGTAAGFYPALRASRLDPIDALRFE